MVKIAENIMDIWYQNLSTSWHCCRSSVVASAFSEPSTDCIPFPSTQSPSTYSECSDCGFRSHIHLYPYLSAPSQISFWVVTLTTKGMRMGFSRLRASGNESKFMPAVKMKTAETQNRGILMVVMVSVWLWESSARRLMSCGDAVTRQFRLCG